MIMHNNTGRGGAVRGPVRRGESLLTGLLRCGHCGHKLHVTYTGKGGSVLRYHCRSAFHSDGPAAKCIQFGALRVEAAVVAEVLRVLKPEGLQAAIAAADTQMTERDDIRRQLDLSLAQAQFEADRAQRQYDATDPDNRLVAAELERRWNERLKHQRDMEEQIAALDRQPAQRLTPEDRQRLLELGHDIEQAWHHPAARPETRKRVIRAIVTEIVVYLHSEHIQLIIHWQGGDHTQLDVMKNKTGQHRWTTPTDVKALITTLARQTADANIAAMMNRAGKRTAHGHTWTESRVRTFRNDHNILVYREGERTERDEITLEEAADLLRVDKMRVRRMIADAILPAAQFAKGLPWVIRRTDLDLPRVQHAVRMRRTRAVTLDPAQPTLDLSTT